jgi:16S rRNA (uracil1498-N3)-methyltransferase
LRVPEVAPLATFAGLLTEAQPASANLFCWEKENEHSLRRAHERLGGAQSVLIAVGPEGGFSASEAELAEQHGFERVHLGRRILRAETAALTAVALVQLLWGDMG